MTSGDGSGGEEAVAEQAARWVARLSSADASDADRRAFADWRAASPAHQAAFDELSDLWSELKGVHPEGGSGGGAKGGLLAALLAVGLGAALHQSGAIDRWRADHSTGVGEVRTVLLPDGTQADLDTDSAISLAYSATERRVELIRGQAFFTVAKEAARPFVVASDGLVATALGTRFEVDGDRDRGPEVEVEEGNVEVAAGGRRLRLEAGDSAGRNPDGLLSPTDLGADVRDATAWRYGRLVFSGQKLGEVLKAIGRYRRGPIFVLDGRAAGLRVSGVFDLGDTDGALAALDATLPVSITNLAGAAVLVRSAN